MVDSTSTVMRDTAAHLPRRRATGSYGSHSRRTGAVAASLVARRIPVSRARTAGTTTASPLTAPSRTGGAAARQENRGGAR
ncbi:hypothetical protein [Streptomyces sp. NPDC006971]|uniref:hypothetical protein n=1 Tax=Streptomyces sp. NPDC006971 TaxID=3154784 RepID=UPI0033C07BB9